MAKIIEIDTNDASGPESEPLCPHCKAAVTQILVKEIKTTFGRKYLYYCSMCRKVLGVSHRKGLLMG